MATNQLLPFGTGAGANVLDFASYNSLAARQAGFSAGTALSVQLNTVWRQSSYVAAMIGQFTADNSGQNVLDNGDVPTLQSNFTKAIAYPVQKGTWIYAAAGGTANALTVTLSPAPTTYAAGMNLHVLAASSNTSGTVTINVNGLGAKTIVRGGGGPLQAGDIKAGQVVALYYDGTQFQISSVRKDQRVSLSTNLTLYVATTGNDSNDGLSAATPFLTLQKAWNTIANTIDLNGFTATVQVADGTYTAGVTAYAPPLGSTAGVAAVTFRGNTASPGSVLIAVTGGNCFLAQGGAQFSITGMQLQTAGANTIGIVASVGGVVGFSNVIFAGCVLSHMNASSGGFIQATGNYSITGGSAFHAVATGGGNVQLSSLTVTLTGTPAFSTAFASATKCGVVSAANYLQTGGASGARYLASSNGVIDTAGGGANYLPGNAVGTTATGGQYV